MLDALVIGAGPYGLSVAAHLRGAELGYGCVGEPMAFWRRMPRGMRLRSTPEDSNIADPEGRLTIAAFLRERGENPADYPVPQPDDRDWRSIPMTWFLEYGEWFWARSGLEVRPELVERLAHTGDGFVARLRSGETIEARAVVIATGIGHFAVIPPELRHLPADRCRHTSQVWEIESLAGQRVLVVGGGQSALEWAALIGEAGAQVWLFERGLPRPFGTLFYDGILDDLHRTEADITWFQRLTVDEQVALLRRPMTSANDHWLLPRLQAAGVQAVPLDHWARRSPAARRIRRAESTASGALLLEFGDRTELTVDQIVCGTGFQIDLDRLTFLAPEVRSGIRRLDGPPAIAGHPWLDDSFQSSVPGLYFAGNPAKGRFGICFNFVAGAGAGARTIARALAQQVGSGAASQAP